MRNQAELVRRMEALADAGVRTVTHRSLSDSGIPTYDEHLAKRLRGFGIPCFGCTPQLLPELLSAANLEQLAARLVKTWA